MENNTTYYSFVQELFNQMVLILSPSCRHGIHVMLQKVHTHMAYQKTLAIRDYLAFTLRSAITECIHKTMAIDRKTT